MHSKMDLGIEALKAAYVGGTQSPADLVKALYPQWQAAKHAFIHLVPLDALLARCAALEGDQTARGPLHGALCGVKDNVDVAGLPTTAACAAYEYTPTESAPTVTALEAAGAIPAWRRIFCSLQPPMPPWDPAAGAIVVGKTNLDQFASGLVGTRSPCGVPGNAFDDR